MTRKGSRLSLCGSRGEGGRWEFSLKRACLILSGIEFVGFHGQAAAERERGNRFRVDLALEGDFERALSTDNLEDTIDYSQVVRAVREVNRARCYLLIESFADAIANALLAAFPSIVKLSIRVMKLDPPGLGRVRSAGIELVKERE